MKMKNYKKSHSSLNPTEWNSYKYYLPAQTKLEMSAEKFWARPENIYLLRIIHVKKIDPTRLKRIKSVRLIVLGRCRKRNSPKLD